MKNTLILLIFCLFGTSFLCAQNEEVEHIVAPVEPVVKNEIFTTVEDMPHFGDCSSSADRNERNICTVRNISSFIEVEIESTSIEEEGKVYIRFVIDENGNLIDAEVAKSATDSLDKLALEIVNKMQDWEPGKQRGKPVKVQYVVPVNFK